MCLSVVFSVCPVVSVADDDAELDDEAMCPLGVYIVSRGVLLSLSS